MNSFKRKISYAFGIIAVFALGFFVTPDAAMAQAPQFNVHPNDCTTVTIGNVDTGQGIVPGGCWTNSNVTASPGEIINVAFYIHNFDSGTTGPSDPAYNTVVAITSNLPTSATNSVNFTGRVTANNTNSVGGNVSVSFTQPSTLELSKTMAIYPDPNSYQQDIVSTTGMFNGGVKIGTVYAGPDEYVVVEVPFKVVAQTTGGGGGGCNNCQVDNYPTATTGSATTGNTSVTINGSFDMNDTQGVRTWFYFDDNQNAVQNSNGTSNSLPRIGIENTNTTGSGFDGHTVSVSQDAVYYYRFCAENTKGIDCGNVKSVNFTGQSTYVQNYDLDIATVDADDIDEDSAVLIGEVVDNNNEVVSRYFEYRREGNSSWITVNAGNSSSQNQFDEKITGLKDDTVYEYRACGDTATDQDCGVIRDFETDREDDDDDNDRQVRRREEVVIREIVQPTPQLPVQQAQAVTLQPTNITATTGVMNGYYNARGNDTQVWFEYGIGGNLNTESDRQAVGFASGTTARTMIGLSPSTTYSYRICAFNSAGLVCGNPVSFTTAAQQIIQPVNTFVPQTSTPVTRTVTNTVVRTVAADTNTNTNEALSFFIENGVDALTTGEVYAYQVEYENVLDETNIDNLVIHVTFPEELRILGTTKGRISERNNTVTVEQQELEAGIADSFIVTTELIKAPAGDNIIVVEGVLGHDDLENPQAASYLNAFDIDEYFVNQTNNGLAASIFGAGFLPANLIGWMIALLVLVLLILWSRGMYYNNKLKSYQVKTARASTIPTPPLS